MAGLLQAAERVFSDRGYHGTSIRDIAREAGFSVGGVYQFFASKDELYLRVLDDQWEHFYQLLNEAAKAEGAEARLHALVEAMFKAFEERQGFFKLFLSERARLSAAFTGEIAARVGEQTKRLRTHLVDLMRAAVEEKVLQPMPPEMLASAFMGMVHNCIFEAMAAGASRPTRPTGEVLALFLHGAGRPGFLSGHPHTTPPGLPSGHPQMAPPGLPPGHPETTRSGPAAGHPHSMHPGLPAESPHPTHPGDPE